MKLILENEQEGQKITIESKNNDMTINDIFEKLIEPALLAIGYHPNSIARMRGEEV